MSSPPELLRIQYVSVDQRFLNYSDMVIYDKEQNLVAVRFGGYPETVQAMADAITMGCTLWISQQESNREIQLHSDRKRNFIRNIAHDGNYAECLCYLNDDPYRSISLDDEDSEEISVVRNLYFYCREHELFQELDRKVSVPLLPEFEKYFIGALYRKGILQKLTVQTLGKELTAWQLSVSNEETELIEILETGLRQKRVQIPGRMKAVSLFLEIKSFTEYLKNFGTQIAKRIQNTFHPLFDPTNDLISERIKEANRFVMSHAGYSLFDAQLSASEALKRQLEKDKLALLVAECGTGKTKIGSIALYASQKGKNSFNTVICPSHVSKKWVREIEETVPNSYAHVVESLSDIDKAYQIYQAENKNVFCVISKERARNGAMRYPAVTWNPIKKGFVCPVCGSIQMMDVFDDDTGSRYKVPADSLHFQKENSKNHKCENCGSVNWSVINPSVFLKPQNEWVHIGEYGYIHRRFAAKHLDRELNDTIRETIVNIVRHPDGIFPALGAYRRYPFSSYIKKHIKHLDALICDELHQYSGESAQGEAMGELADVAKKVIGMTATLLNGYAKGMFYLLFRLKPHLMLSDHQQYAKAKDFCQEYGVVKRVYQFKTETYNNSTRNRRRKTQEKFLPGVSPLVYSKFLLENTVFLSLANMGKELPDYEEIPVPCHLTDNIEKEYSFMESELKKILSLQKDISQKIQSNYLNLLIAYPDQPYGHRPIIHPHTKEVLLEPKDLSVFEDLQPKDEQVIELVERKIKSGERVIIYTSWVRLDSQKKLLKQLTSRGFRTRILDTKIPPIKREEWVDKRVSEGIDVLIVNPSLTETGLDLNAFTTLIFYNIAFNLYVFRQASRRSWRINQTAPKVEVYLFYYVGTMQQRALKLMASKLAAATAIEGNISDEGLAALSDCKDMTTLLAKELMLGIQDRVEDLASTFQKMAIRNHREEKAEVSPTKPVVRQLPSPQPEPTPAPIVSVTKLRKKLPEQAEQFSLFDLLKVS